MNKYFGIILAAIIGGSFALGGAYFLGLGQQVKVIETQVEVEKPIAQFSKFDAEKADDLVPATGFAVAAEKTLPAVVHIKAAKRADAGGQSQIDPDNLPPMFRDFFGPRGFDQDDQQAPLQRGSGSGVIISQDGYIVTNNHVVEEAEEIKVVLNDQRTYDGTIIGVDPTTDVALIKIEETALPTVKFADSDAIKIGEWVVAVGNPFSLTSTVTAGIVSAKGRSIDILREKSQYAIESFIQTDAVVNPGNSGGALVNINGDLVGINTAISSPTGVFAGYSFAVPSKIVAKVVEDLREFGVVQRGYLGARIIELNSEFAAEQGIDRDNGVYISGVTPKSAAEEGGLQEGDVVTAVDGVATLRNSELLEQLGRRRPGDEVTITLERNGAEMDKVVTLKNQAGTTEAVTASTAPALYDRLGAEIGTVSEDGAKELNIDGGVQIVRLRKGILTEQTRIREGFVITEIDGKPIADVNDLESILNNKEGAVALRGIYPGQEEEVGYALMF
ncbi:MAG: Do family serine endopeptidase [Bacteroidota bacterium]